jgi:hypothetical protein
VSTTTRAEQRPSSTRRVLAALLAFALVSILVLRTSDAAFTAGDSNEDNLFRTATIDLDVLATVPLFGDDTNDALVDATDLIPGSEVTGCLEVEFIDTAGVAAGNLDPVELALGWGGTGSAALAGWLDVEVAVHSGCESSTAGAGSGVTVGNPSGSVSPGFGPQPTTWTPSGDGDKVGYVFTVTVNPEANDTVQGVSVEDVDLIWSVSTN